ncbi:XdhC family protein [Alteromonas sp. 5E99-2]|uniref:XdhC family protein n=1 Tax=Alteromonas sp. 5E99-2 TaxID=2817683 RepID=UPI001A98C6D4|nr:XdhC family protein [Alteromonas sp. 5E99-2]MBO1256154.1 XdhC family protein [Alteromonas sp. 5E99-2]
MLNKSCIYTQLMDVIHSHSPHMLASVIYTENSTSARVGDKALINANGDIKGWIGGGCCQSVVQSIAPELLKGNTQCVIRICPENAFVDDKVCYPSTCPSEGTIDIFLEPIANQQVLRLYGSTPIAKSIVNYSNELNLRLDWREEVEPNNSIELPANMAVIATQGKGDFEALSQALTEKIEHILFVASHKKTSALKQKLIDSGVCSEDVENIIAPAGIDIGAKSGAEIALSIMAKVVSLKNSTSLKNTENKIETKVQPSTSSCCGGKVK